MRIDFHTHAFPDALAGRAVPRLAHDGGGLIPVTNGTVASLAANMASAGIDRSVVLNIAVKPSQQRSILAFCEKEACDPVIPFASVHPFAPDALEMLEEIARAGIKGIKLHPQYQGFAADDPACFPVYRKIARLGLVTVFHAGLDIAKPLPCLAAPDMLARALPAFDGSPVVAAHWGGYMLWQDVPRCLKGTGIYVDTSFSHGRVIVPMITDIIEALGADHILYGSDSPWSGPEGESALIEALPFTPREREAVYGGNACRLLNLAHS